MRGEALLALGRNEEALPDLERFVDEYPYRERLLQHLMLARVRVGRITEALAAYHEARARLDEIGLEPGPRPARARGAHPPRGPGAGPATHPPQPPRPPDELRRARAASAASSTSSLGAPIGSSR